MESFLIKETMKVSSFDHVVWDSLLVDGDLLLRLEEGCLRDLRLAGLQKLYIIKNKQLYIYQFTNH